MSLCFSPCISPCHRPTTTLTLHHQSSTPHPHRLPLGRSLTQPPLPLAAPSPPPQVSAALFRLPHESARTHEPLPQAVGYSPYHLQSPNLPDALGAPEPSLTAPALSHGPRPLTHTLAHAHPITALALAHANGARALPPYPLCCVPYSTPSHRSIAWRTLPSPLFIASP